MLLCRVGGLWAVQPRRNVDPLGVWHRTAGPACGSADGRASDWRRAKLYPLCRTTFGSHIIFPNFWHDSPNIWWPADRKWCVATDIDLDSSYVGGNEACIEALANNGLFEALPTTLDAPVYLDADTLNTDEVER